MVRVKLIQSKLILLFLTVILFSCQGEKAVDSEVEINLETIARKIIKDAKNCTLITSDTLGLTYARPMDPFLPESDFTIWMATNPKSSKVKQLRENPKSTLFYFHPKNGAYVTLQGSIEIVNSQVEKDKHWKEEWKNFYHNKTTDFLLLKFKPNRGFVISETHKIFGDSITWSPPVFDL